MFAKHQSYGAANGLHVVSLHFLTYERIEGKSNQNIPVYYTL